MSVIKLQNDQFKSFIEKMDIVGKEKDAVLTIFMNKSPKTDQLMITGRVNTPDLTQQVMATMVVDLPKDYEDGECYMSFSMKCANFTGYAWGLLSFKEEIGIIEKNGSYYLTNSKAQMKLDVFAKEAGVINPIAISKEDAICYLAVSRKELTRLFREDGCFYLKDAGDTTGKSNAVLHITETELSMASTDGLCIAHGKCPVSLSKKSKWDEMVEKQKPKTEDDTIIAAIDLAVPGKSITKIVSCLTSSTCDEVHVAVDDKYLHIHFEQNCMLSMRLGAKAMNMEKRVAFRYMDSKFTAVVDKTALENGVKLISQKLSVCHLQDKAGVHLLYTKKGLRLSAGADSIVMIPWVEEPVGDESIFDVFLSAELLLRALGIVSNTNLVLKYIMETTLTLGNGSIEDGFAESANMAILAGLYHETAKNMEDQISNGTYDTKSEDNNTDKTQKAKKGKKKEVSETDENEETKQDETTSPSATSNESKEDAHEADLLNMDDSLEDEEDFTFEETEEFV